MAPPVVIALFRSLLRSTQTLQRDILAGRLLYNAVRSGAIASYAGIKTDWQREQLFLHCFDDVKVLKRRTQDDRTYAAIVRAGFVSPVNDKAALNARIDAAFITLKRVDDHNALLQKLIGQGCFQPKDRTSAIKFRIGDIIQVKNEKRGVIFAWHMTLKNAAIGPEVVYDVLPHSPGYSFASKLYNVPQDEIRLDETPKAIIHSALLLYFDGFDSTRHIPSEALLARYPSDFSKKIQHADRIVATPSIIHVQSADENELLKYLRCDDSTIVQFAMASLEGKWIGEGGQNAQDHVQRAIRLVNEKKWSEAREMLQQVVYDVPLYAYAWNKLALVEYQSGNSSKALENYEIAVKLKPQLIEALVGLGICATKLQRWPVVHHTAVQLLNIQPSNDTAHLLLNQAIYATL